MREIKFRAWDKKGNQMIENEELMFSGTDGFYSLNQEGQEFEWDCVMQFTGLHDKNGKEIYEGDIVNYGNYTDNNKPCNEKIIFENCSFVGREIRKFGDKNAVSMIGKDCEVIGNIYENPELLTKK